MPFFEYFALDPLVIRNMMDNGPGALPLINTSTAYDGVETALDSAASGTDGLLTTMAEAWPGGLSTQRAQSAFRKHNEWVRQQAAVASFLSKAASASAELHRAVDAAIPSRVEIVAAIAKRAAATTAAAATAGTPAGTVATAAVAAAEAEYMVLRLRAGAGMMAYEAGAMEVVSTLLSIPIEPPPPIVVAPDGSGPVNPPDTSGPLQDLLTNGPNSDVLTGDHHPTQTTGDPTQSTGDPGQSTGGSDGGSGDPGTDPTQPPTQATPDQPVSDIQQPIGSESAMGPGTETYGLDSANPDSLYGTSPTSPTLAGLGGGAGSLVALGMARGGIGMMPGAATGFRLPGGWTPGSGTPFGASSGAPTGAPVRNAPKRVSAPTARMRRRRKEEEERTGKVFTPGEQLEVPVLERPPAIGVIEYQDEEPEAELLIDSSLVGVLDRLDDEVEQDNRESSR
ncbi:PPE domain-containing protein [Nocardia grenadensis]|uniref:PPE domain-containing protein n=1 Tax=Nocardia grenadensis TaxID=931537 RepID=UPI003D8D25DC